jgi:hypothetical protein
MFAVRLARNGVLAGMTNDQFEHHAYRMSTEPSYQAGYRSGFAGEATPRHIGVLLEPVAWAHGWRVGVTEATDKVETIADSMRSKGTKGSPLDVTAHLPRVLRRSYAEGRRAG